MNIVSLPFGKEITYCASRSSGKGGQHVNKVSTKIELSFDVANSKILTNGQKQKISEKLFQHINKEGILKITAETSRSQQENREIALKKFLRMISDCFRPVKKRIATKRTRASEEKRLNEKKIQSKKKQLRKKTSF
jgi:ribosome-associated protein